MPLESNTLKELRAMCSRELDLFKGYSRYNKADLVVFMNEKINGQIYIDIPNNQGEELDNPPPTIAQRLGPIPRFLHPTTHLLGISLNGTRVLPSSSM